MPSTKKVNCFNDFFSDLPEAQKLMCRHKVFQSFHKIRLFQHLTDHLAPQTTLLN